MSISVKTIILEGCLRYDGLILLRYKIEYPKFCSSCFSACLDKINARYQKKALEYQKYCKTELFNLAIAQYKDDLANGYPIRVFEIMQTYRLTYLCACVLSLYFDRYEYIGGAHGNTLRNSETWQLQECGRIQLPELVCCQPDYKTYILEKVEAQIRKNPELYFENYPELIEQTFNADSFYAASLGLVIYYQQYDIAPYSSGIREFLIPWGGCVTKPASLCP